MKYIDEEFVIGINKCICESQGVQSVIINRNNLLSALSVQQWYDDDCERACALLRSISIGHPFKDGNKRTAAIVAIGLKEFNVDDAVAEDIIVDIASGKLKEVKDIKSLLYKDTE